AAEIMHVRPNRELVHRDLGDGTDHDDAPIGARVGDRSEEREIDPFIEHAEISEARTGEQHLIVRFRSPAPRGFEMGAVDAGWEWMDVSMQGAFCLKEAVAAG